MEKEIKIYRTATGKLPFIEWLKSVKNTTARHLIQTRIRRIEVSGNVGDYKNLKDGVYEMRIHKSPGYRIYYGLEGKALIILLVGGEKGNQKRDINKAKEYWQDYLKF